VLNTLSLRTVARSSLPVSCPELRNAMCVPDRVGAALPGTQTTRWRYRSPRRAITSSRKDAAIQTSIKCPSDTSSIIRPLLSRLAQVRLSTRPHNGSTGSCGDVAPAVYPAPAHTAHPVSVIVTNRVALPIGLPLRRENNGLLANDRVSAAAAHDRTSRRRLQTLVRLRHFK
jgi:hypothetical protein